MYVHTRRLRLRQPHRQSLKPHSHKRLRQIANIASMGCVKQGVCMVGVYMAGCQWCIQVMKQASEGIYSGFFERDSISQKVLDCMWWQIHVFSGRGGAKMKNKITRMYSSRMRTVRSSSRLPSFSSGGGGMHVVGRAWGGWGEGCVAGETATVAGRTHPTGMHSCFYIVSINQINQEKLQYLIRIFILDISSGWCFNGVLSK